jgi:phage terminase large subunit
MTYEFDIHKTKIIEQNILNLNRYNFNQGGTFSGKTYGLNELIFNLAKLSKHNRIFSIVSESLPHLKLGALRDFLDFLKTNNLYDSSCHNRSDNYYQVNNSIIEFFGIDNATKTTGPKRDYLFANEIQNLPYETFFQLAQRTKKKVWADYNPTREFWVHKEYLQDETFKKDINYVHSTLFDNPYIPEVIKNDVIRRANKDENYARVYLRGEIGSIEGLIFPNFKIIDDVPKEFYLVGNGIDFGYNDPMTLDSVYRFENNICIDECYHETEHITADLIKFIKENNISGYNYADQSRADSISEIQRSGIHCIGARKGPGSIKEGINIIKKYNIFVTKRSVNTIKELRSYSWLKDKNGKYTDMPQDFDNHHIDNVRYVAVERLNIPAVKKGLKVFKRA